MYNNNKTYLSLVCLAFAWQISTPAAVPDNTKNAKTISHSAELPDNTPGGAADTSRVYDLDEVVIISQPKEVMSLRHQPLSSSVFSGRDINNLGAHGLSDVAAYVPSFAMPAYGSRLTSSIYVRGVGSRVNNPAVGIYVDGIPLVSKNSFNFHTYQLDRIDVLRGPQGTLYGMNTEGGLVRLYSKSPMKYQGTDIRLGLGTHFYRNIEASHYVKTSDSFAFSVSGFYNGQNGFFRNSTTGRRADASDEAGGKTRMIYKPNDRLTADFTADYQYVDQRAFPYGMLDAATGHIDRPSTNRRNNYKRNMLNTGLGLTYDAGSLTFGSQTSYQFLRDRMDMDQDYLPEDYMHLEQRQLINALTQELTLKSNAETAWRHTSGLYGSYQWLKTDAPVFFDKDFTGRIASGIQSAMYSSILQAMAEQMAAAGMPQAVAEQTAAAAIEQAGGVSADVSMQVPALFHTPQVNIGVFHESNIGLTDRLTATVGLRYDYNRVSVNYDTSAAMAVTASVMGAQSTSTVASILTSGTHDSYSQLLPKIGLSLTVDQAGSNVYAVVSKGYRAGGYNIQMFSDILQAELTSSMPTANTAGARQGGTDDGNTTYIPHTADDYERVNRTITYKPEESWNYEIGAHLNLFDDKLHADLSAYCMQIRNQQLSVMASGYGFGRMMVNAGRSRSLGLEAALRGSAVADRVTWAATYAFTASKFTEYDETGDDGQTVSYAGNSVPYVPRHTLSLRADLRLPLGTNASRAFLAGADLTAQGRTYWDEANTASQPFYALLGLYAGLQWGKASLRLWCRNATNTRYATFAFSSSASGHELWFAQKGNPVQAGVDITLRL